MLGILQESMSAQLVSLATNEKLKEPDWARNIEICEEASYSPEKAKDVIKAIKKRLSSKNQNSQLLAVVLLEMLMNNCGEHIHRLVIDKGVLQMLVKIVKKKSDLPVREKIFLLLDATQTAVGGASGKFPQYYAAYYDLVRSRVQFPSRTTVPASTLLAQIQANDLPTEAAVPQKPQTVPQPPNSKSAPDSSIIEKATNVMELLREVLDAVDPLHPEGATDEFTLDLVEQCSFHKQRVMHLVMTSRDEKLVSQAIELNDQLQKLLTKHDALLSLPNSCSIAVNHEETEEEEPDRLFRRARKGKACAHAWREDQAECSSSSSSGSFSFERPHPPVGLSVNRSPLRIEPREPAPPQVPAVIPPPPAKHKERELFFREKQVGSVKVGQMLGSLSLHSRTGSSSRSGSTEFSE
ncbi:TOM1-like protein 5 isoform X2 [Nymphaea colorata]|uniref:TOM1-like protein 5 isoform X2 n=1 Tax=Nymphaea colorata TaxID=210225 RepID=UPI00129EEF67|nr:TOM1-like protein 5 isoform X2 [Nymphaea colorata]